MRRIRVGGADLLLAGLRSRARLYSGLFACAVLVIGAAVSGQVFSTAAQESIVRDTMSAADAGVRLHAELSPFDTTYPPSSLAQILPEAPAAGALTGFPTRTPTMTIASTVRIPTRAEQPSHLIWRGGFCQRLRIVAGRCPTRTGEALISQSTSIGGNGWAVGAAVRSAAAGMLHVVGVYAPATGGDPLWNGSDFLYGGLDAAPDLSAPPGSQALGVDDLFVTESTFLARVPSGADVSLDYPVDEDGTTIGDGRGLEDEIGALRHRLASSDWRVQDGLADPLRSAHAQRAYVQQGAGFVAAQLALLGVVVLFFIVLDLLQARRSEVALARLRGQGLPAVLRFVLGEPAAVVLAALPVGVLLGWGAAAGLGAILVRPGTPADLPPSALLAAAFALIGALAAACLVGIGIVRRPVLEQWRESRTSRRRVPRPLVAALLLLAALGIVGAMLLGGPGSSAVMPVPLVALVAVAALVVVGLTAAARRSTSRNRGTPRLTAFLVSRQLARSPLVGRTAVLLTATLGLAAFGIGGQTVLAMNRAARAQAELGASRVATVQLGSVDPLDAVHEADPSGRWAMAAARWLPNDGGSVLGTVLAVDTPRLSTVGLPLRGGLSDRQLEQRLQAQHLPDLVVPGSTIALRIRTDALRGGGAPGVVVALRELRSGHETTVPLGSLRPGVHDYVGETGCAGSCAVEGITWSRPADADGTISGSVTVQRISSAGRALPALLTDAGAWRSAAPTSGGTDRVTSSASGLVDVFRSQDGDNGVVRAGTPAVVPAVVTPAGVQPTRPPGGWEFSDVYGASVPFEVAGTTPLLPAVLDYGVITDVRTLDRRLPAFVWSAQWEVWLSPSAPADAVRRLERAGLSVSSVQSVDGRVAQLGRDGPALAFGMLSALAIVAALLALLSTVVSATAGARQRAREMAAMRLIGVPDRVIVRAAVLEQALLIAVSVAVALVLGVLADLVVLPLMRQFSDTTPVPLSFVPDPVALIGFVLLSAAAVVGAAAITARSTARVADLRRLREVDS